MDERTYIPASGEVADLIAQVRDHHDGTAAHLERVGELACAIAGELDMSLLDRPEVVAAFWLHDVGKLAVPPKVLNSSRRLQPRERAIVKLHASVGGNLLASRRMLSGAAPIVRAHHERLDGLGYPDGLKGEEIPLPARVLAVADVYDVIRRGRPYQESVSHEDAVAELAGHAGTQFDPDCVAALARVTQGAPALARA